MPKCGAALLTTVAALLLATAAAAEDHVAVVTNPEWLKVPGPDDLAGAWPAAAARKGVGGRAVVNCAVTVKGLLTDCTVVAEKPAGMGFGFSALLLTARFMMRPQMRDGAPVGGARVAIPINFEGPGTSTGTHLIGAEGPEIRVLRDPLWADAPTAAAVAAAYPASGRGVVGHVAMRCKIEPDGGLKACETVTESPAGHGFGVAARSLSPSFRIIPESADPHTLAIARVDVPVHFQPSAPQAPARVDTDPDWIRVLSSDKIQEVFPDKAADAGLQTGRAVLDCVADVHGGMTAYQVLNEEPEAMGFGPAALRVAAAMGINPWTVTGEAMEGAHVKFAIRLNRKEPEASTPPATH